MKYEVIDKNAAVPEARTGEAAELYRDLVALMEEQPEKKLVVDFGRMQAGYRAVQRIIPWATEDGLLVFQRVIKGTAKRELHVERAEDMP